MKKALFALLFLFSFPSSFAAVPQCTNLSGNLSRGMESGAVLALQNFLYAKGILKVLPNGYFGPSTIAAVKAYQKTQGFSQVGTVGPSTRAAIKKESCTPGNVQSVQTAPSNPQNGGTTGTSATPSGPRPVIDSFDPVSLFAGGTANWSFSLYGSNFSTSSNVVIFTNTGTWKSYTIGSLPSATGTTVLLPSNLTGTSYPCGIGCNETLEAGTYEVTVATHNGTSDPKILAVYSFTMSAQTTLANAAPASAQGTRVGAFSFSSPQAIDVTDVHFSLGTSTISSGGLGNVILKDELTGAQFSSAFSLQAFQSELFGAYADTNNTAPGTVYGSFSVTIRDYVGKHDTVFTSRPILITVAGVL